MTILAVEGTPGDLRLLKEALKNEGIEHHLDCATNGVIALEMLDKKRDSPPDLILLDLNLPRKSGHEVLEVIKNDPDLQRIPVVILSTSRSTEDVSKCYDLYANSYLVKPFDYDDFVMVVRSIKIYWLKTSARPNEAYAVQSVSLHSPEIP